MTEFPPTSLQLATAAHQLRRWIDTSDLPEADKKAVEYVMALIVVEVWNTTFEFELQGGKT